MSINHYSSLDLPETTLWWTQNPQHQQMEPTIPNNPSWPLHHHKNLFNLNNNNNQEEFEEQQQNSNNNNNDEQATTSNEREAVEEDEEEKEEEEEKEPMFEKPLTPSDVGKLNRLVIPKQHAEKYFPLGAASGSNNNNNNNNNNNSLSSTSTTASNSGECKGLLLSFEDESGKCWRFRYSYWNSSQSYVLTKGWSRYVKDKRLDAGDVVSFERRRGDSQRLFIRWRRRSAAAATATAAMGQVSRTDGSSNNNGNGNGKSGGGAVGWTSGFYCAHPSYHAHHQHQQLVYHQQQHEGIHAGKGSQVGLNNQRTIPTTIGNCSSSSSSSSSKILRLFGVNMECQTQHHDSSSSTLQGEDSNHTLYHNIHHHQPPNSNYSTNSNSHHMVHQQPYYY